MLAEALLKAVSQVKIDLTGFRLPDVSFSFIAFVRSTNSLFIPQGVADVPAAAHPSFSPCLWHSQSIKS
jgi:hypothetical protein